MGRLPLPIGQRKYQIRELHSLHKEIGRRQLLGQKSVEIARDLGISPVTVCYTSNSILGDARRQELELARDTDCVQVAKQIREIAPIAIGIVRSLMESAVVSPFVRLSAAKDVLDRAGFGAPTRISGQILHAHLTAEDLKEIKQRARNAGVCVSADFVESRQCGAMNERAMNDERERAMNKGAMNEVVVEAHERSEQDRGDADADADAEYNMLLDEVEA